LKGALSFEAGEAMSRFGEDAIAPEVVEQLRIWATELAGWPKTLSSELFSRKWLSDLSRTDQGVEHGDAGDTLPISAGLRTRSVTSAKLSALVRGTGGSDPCSPASESHPSPEENHSFAPSDRDRLGHNFFCGNTAGR
jgi:hypothetical protein